MTSDKAWLELAHEVDLMTTCTHTVCPEYVEVAGVCTIS